MSEFKTPLIIEEIDELAGKYRLIAPLVYQSDLRGEIVVPADFITDFASVPRLPLAYLLVGGKGNRAAVVHDWLYSTAKISRKQADEVLAEALRASGYSALTVSLMWLGVRAGGESHWNLPNVPQEPHVERAMALA
jgi:hypothetical protein